MPVRWICWLTFPCLRTSYNLKESLQALIDDALSSMRDLLPIVEGTTVTTRYGPVKTDHILFIAAGAFHNSKPNDLMKWSRI